MAYDKQAARDRAHEVQAFRDHARDLTISHLSTLLEYFVCAPHCPLRFDVLRVRKLEAQLARLMQMFVSETHVDSISAEELELARGLEDEKFKDRAEKASERIEQLWPPMRPKGH